MIVEHNSQPPPKMENKLLFSCPLVKLISDMALSWQRPKNKQTHTATYLNKESISKLTRLKKKKNRVNRGGMMQNTRHSFSRLFYFEFYVIVRLIATSQAALWCDQWKPLWCRWSLLISLMALAPRLRAALYFSVSFSSDKVTKTGSAVAVCSVPFG